MVEKAQEVAGRPPFPSPKLARLATAPFSCGDRFVYFALNDAVDHRAALLEHREIAQEMADDRRILIMATTRGVRRHEAVRQPPEHVLGR